jgi:hypothetical protein
MAFAESTVQGDRNLTRKGMAEHTDALDGNREEADLVARRFNHDLLLDSADQESAARRWPSISRILIEHDLIDAFKPHEDRAKRLKLAVLRLGSVAVILTFVALLGSALHVWTESSSSGIEGSVAGTTVETCAVLGLLSAVLASRYGPLRRRWLMNRFMTEVLRQWHFRLLLDGTAISEFLGPGHNESLRRRRQHLSALLHDFKGTVGQKMDQLIEKGFDPLDRIREPQLPNHPDAQKQLLEAYRVLRLDHQREFAVYITIGGRQDFSWPIEPRPDPDRWLSCSHDDRFRFDVFVGSFLFPLHMVAVGHNLANYCWSCRSGVARRPGTRRRPRAVSRHPPQIGVVDSPLGLCGQRCRSFYGCGGGRTSGF